MTIDPHVIQAFAKSIGVYQFMNTTWGWPLVESLHFVGLSMLLGTVGVFDLRVLGLGRGVSMATLHRLLPLGVAAYALSMATGSLFIMAMPDQYLFNPAFQLKIGCMIVAGINVIAYFAIASRRVRAAGPDDDALLAAKIIAALSLACWIAVIIFGRVITLFRPPWHWCFWC